MTDDVKKVVAWLRRTAGGVPHLETLLAHIDGELARQAAAIASAREEQREACAVKVDWWGPTLRPVAEHVRATPLDATPLADELRTLRARVAELEAQLGGMTEQWKAELNHANAWMRKHQAAEAQVAAARAVAAEELDHGARTVEAGEVAADVLRAMDEATKK